MELLEAERAEEEAHEVDAALDLGLHLVRPAEDVGVVLREPAHTQQPVQHAGALVAVDGAQLGHTDGQVAVAAEGVLVHLDVERAVHRLHVVVLPVDVHRRVHVLGVEVEVAARLPERRLADVRRVDDVIAGSEVLLAPEVLDQSARASALRVPVDEAGTELLVEREEVQLAAESAVVAAGRLLDPLEVLVELLLCVEERAVDALEHGVVLVAAPVRAGDAHQLEIGHLAGALDVRTLAEVDELTLAVEAQLLVGDLVDQLELEGLVREALRGPRPSRSAKARRARWSRCARASSLR